MKKKVIFYIVLLVMLIWPLTAVAQDPSPPAIVQVVIFYSPTCPHCHDVINNVLPTLADQYGDQLQILGIDTSREIGSLLYEATVDRFQIPNTRRGVPAMLVGDVVMVGSQEIPQQLPGLIAAGLEAGGIGWPDIPGLTDAVPDLPPSADPRLMAAAAPTNNPGNDTAATADVAQTATLDLADMDATVSGEAPPPPSDPVGMAVGWVVLAGMVGALLFGLWRSVRATPYLPGILGDPEARLVGSIAVPLLVTVGLVVSFYLAYVEINQVTAVCGPIGECNLVQSSSYAQIMGIPVAVLGVISYLLIGALWIFQRQLNERFNNLGVYGLLFLTFIGTLFSIYLTLLELFVIGAVCAWCLTSAVVTTLLFLIVVHQLTKRPLLFNPEIAASA